MKEEQQLKDLQKTIDDAQKQMKAIMLEDDFEFSGGRYIATGYCDAYDGHGAKEHLAAGNRFKTREFATYVAKMRLRQNIMLKAAERFNPEGWRPDFSVIDQKHFIYYDHRMGDFMVGSVLTTERPEGIFFASVEVAKQVIPFIKYHMEKLAK